MRKIAGLCRRLGVFAFALCLLAAVAGCEGTETREHVDDTVEELAGKKNVDRMHDMEDKIDKFEKDQARKYEELENADGEK